MKMFQRIESFRRRRRGTGGEGEGRGGVEGVKVREEEGEVFPTTKRVEVFTPVVFVLFHNSNVKYLNYTSSCTCLCYL